MPLSKAKMRERKRQDRLVKPMSNLTNPELVKPKLEELRQLIKNIEAKPALAPKIPLYNPYVHRPGDLVLVQQGKRLVETVIPELDADGNPMPI